MSKNYYKVSKLKGYYRMKYEKSNLQIVHGSINSIYPDIDLVRMKEYTKRDKNVLPHPSFAHSTEKGDYIKEVQNKLQYSDGKGTFDLKNVWGRTYYHFYKNQRTPKIEFMNYLNREHDNLLRSPEKMAWNIQDYIKAALDIRSEKLKARGYTGEDDK